ncbi:MAG: DUF1743 domain-containing protein [Candidatus Thorarchaeota archaeon]|nr:DUF1743 domain-containing protein [Candidatus Thorarchaeota archaeon]
MDEMISVGLDDIDSPSGGCTTHFATLLVEQLEEAGVTWCDYPNLIRLNPNIPFRTRGNGAVCLRFRSQAVNEQELTEMVASMLDVYVKTDYPNTNPGVVVVRGGVPEDVVRFAETAVWRAVPIPLAIRIIKKHSAQSLSRGNGRGLVGAVAAVGNLLLEDHTYEYIAYRTADQHEAERHIDHESVRRMDRVFSQGTFSNVDEETGTLMIAPHGPDPVLFGIRGESPDLVVEAARMVRLNVDVDRWAVFRTNQGTGAHLRHNVTVDCLRPYMSASVTGRVASKPRVIEGGHVLFSVTDASGSIDCAAYEPSGSFRDVVLQLTENDTVTVQGGVRPASRTHGMTVNIEGLEVISLSNNIAVRNPLCPDCGRRMKSAGRAKGYKCEHCGHRSREMSKQEVELARTLTPGLYLPPTRAQRHLTRPERRLYSTNAGRRQTLISVWHGRRTDTERALPPDRGH